MFSAMTTGETNLAGGDLTQLVTIDVGPWGLTWGTDRFGRLHQIGAGPAGRPSELDVDPMWYPDAFPTWGGGDPLRSASLRITHADGTLTTRLVIATVERHELSDGVETVVRCRDELFDLAVDHHLRTHPASGMLEQWLEVEHDEAGPIRLHEYDSIAPLLLIDEQAEICQFGGSGWADEWSWTTQRLGPGTLTLDSFGGVQPHLRRSPCLLVSPSGPSDETSGEVIGLSIAWGGNVRFALDVCPRAEANLGRELRLRAGANPVGADYLLDPGVRFVSPTVAWTWSDTGRAEVTRRFHDWTRARVLRRPNRTRPLVVNNWEATFFDFDEERLVGLVDRTADLGADLFLLDDGWFGTTHPRNDDDAGLGDWDVNIAKLPGGLASLCDAAERRGVRFGVWLEPEMVNPVSDLFTAHPDWILRDRRDPREHRNQFFLDPLIPEVRSFEVDVFERTLGPNPGISYVKWDANRPITDPGSSTLASDRQANVWFDHVRATWEVMSSVSSAHPDVEFMLCASGGGRTDHGTLRWFDEFWTSDNTDPVTRVRMQWACSHFFPASTMAAHVTRWGERPIGFACAVSLSGRFGIDVDLTSLDDSEFEVCRRAVAIARRTQDLVQHGVLRRLISPVEGDDRSRAALAYVSVERDRAVVFAYQLDRSALVAPRLRITDLELDTTYSVTTAPLSALERDAVDDTEVPRFTGAELAAGGLEWPLEQPCTATIWELSALS